jgi:YgiT-type zinc finger domain-containing protein
MICNRCGSSMDKVSTDLPFKLGPSSIVIVRALPAHQCTRCSEYLIEDEVMERLEEIFRSVDRRTELEIVRYAA